MATTVCHKIPHPHRTVHAGTWQTINYPSCLNKASQKVHKPRVCLVKANLIMLCQINTNSLYWIGLILAFSVLVVWNCLPAKSETPVKVSPVVGTGVRQRFVELEGVQIDGCDLGAHHRGGFLHDASQERFKPTVEALAFNDKTKACVNVKQVGMTYFNPLKILQLFCIGCNITELPYCSTPTKAQSERDKCHTLALL